MANDDSDFDVNDLLGEISNDSDSESAGGALIGSFVAVEPVTLTAVEPVTQTSVQNVRVAVGVGHESATATAALRKEVNDTAQIHHDDEPAVEDDDDESEYYEEEEEESPLATDVSSSGASSPGAAPSQKWPLPSADVANSAQHRLSRRTSGGYMPYEHEFSLGSNGSGEVRRVSRRSVESLPGIRLSRRSVKSLPGSRLSRLSVQSLPAEPLTPVAAETVFTTVHTSEAATVLGSNAREVAVTEPADANTNAPEVLGTASPARSRSASSPNAGSFLRRCSSVQAAGKVQQQRSMLQSAEQLPMQSQPQPRLEQSSEEPAARLRPQLSGRLSFTKPRGNDPGVRSSVSNATSRPSSRPCSQPSSRPASRAHSPPERLSMEPLTLETELAPPESPVWSRASPDRAHLLRTTTLQEAMHNGIPAARNSRHDLRPRSLSPSSSEHDFLPDEDSPHNVVRTPPQRALLAACRAQVDSNPVSPCRSGTTPSSGGSRPQPGPGLSMRGALGQQLRLSLGVAINSSGGQLSARRRPRPPEEDHHAAVGMQGRDQSDGLWVHEQDKLLLGSASCEHAAPVRGPDATALDTTTLSIAEEGLRGCFPSATSTPAKTAIPNGIWLPKASSSNNCSETAAVLRRRSFGGAAMPQISVDRKRPSIPPSSARDVSTGLQPLLQVGGSRPSFSGEARSRPAVPMARSSPMTAALTRSAMTTAMASATPISGPSNYSSPSLEASLDPSRLAATYAACTRPPDAVDGLAHKAQIHDSGQQLADIGSTLGGVAAARAQVLRLRALVASLSANCDALEVATSLGQAGCGSPGLALSFGALRGLVPVHAAAMQAAADQLREQSRRKSSAKLPHEDPCAEAARRLKNWVADLSPDHIDSARQPQQQAESQLPRLQQQQQPHGLAHAPQLQPTQQMHIHVQQDTRQHPQHPPVHHYHQTAPSFCSSRIQSEGPLSARGFFAAASPDDGAGPHAMLPLSWQAAADRGSPANWWGEASKGQPNLQPNVQPWAAAAW